MLNSLPVLLDSVLSSTKPYRTASVVVLAIITTAMISKIARIELETVEIETSYAMCELQLPRYTVLGDFKRDAN